MSGPTFRYTRQPCPQCGAEQDAASSPTDPWAQPADGAVMICFYCARPNIYRRGRLTAPTPAELADIEDDLEVQEMMRRVRSVPFRPTPRSRGGGEPG